VQEQQALCTADIMVSATTVKLMGSALAHMKPEE
jgi:hypothetical protein